MNVYLARLEGHGLQVEAPLQELTADGLWESAKHALAVGARIGDRVVLMGTSTGGTLALKLAAECPETVAALVLYSPNVDVFDPNARVLLWPWGLQLARLITGSAWRSWEPGPEATNYWYDRYRLEGTVALKALIDGSMNQATFSSIRQPTLVLGYYASESRQDSVISIPRMREMYEQLGTQEAQKIMHMLPDVGHHIMTSPYFSQDMNTVSSRTKSFLEESLPLVPGTDVIHSDQE